MIRKYGNPFGPLVLGRNIPYRKIMMWLDGLDGLDELDELDELRRVVVNPF
jgi:hypothetical protein